MRLSPKHKNRQHTIGPVMPGRSMDARMHSVSSLSVLKCPPLLLNTTAFSEATPLAITCSGLIRVARAAEVRYYEVNCPCIHEIRTARRVRRLQLLSGLDKQLMLS